MKKIRKTKIKHKSRMIRGAFITAVAVLFLWALGEGVHSYLQYRKSYSYAKSHADTGIRQLYLNRLLRHQVFSEGLKKLEYRHESLKGYYFPEEPVAMATRFLVSSAKISDMMIFVYPSAFARAGSEDEFLSMLVDHEDRHVGQGTGKVQLQFSHAEYGAVKPELEQRLFNIDGDLYLLFSELDAFESQIKAFPRREISQGFQRKMFHDYGRLQDSLAVKQETPLVHYLKKRFPMKISLR